VVYLALEEKRAEVKRHFAAMGARADDEIFIHAASAPPKALKALRPLVEEWRPALLIIDPLLRFMRVKDESAYAEVTAALEPILELARQTGAHVGLVHHSNKKGEGADAILGSTAIRGAVDCSLILERNGDMRTISSEQRYGQDMDEQILLMDEKTGLVSLGGTKQAYQQRQRENAILKFVYESVEPVTESLIHENVEGRKQNVLSALKCLLRDGIVERTGTGKKGDPFLYVGLCAGDRVPPFSQGAKKKVVPKNPPVGGGYQKTNFTNSQNNYQKGSTRGGNEKAKRVPENAFRDGAGYQKYQLFDAPGPDAWEVEI
jgi:hypothetical protein